MLRKLYVALSSMKLKISRWPYASLGQVIRKYCPFRSMCNTFRDGESASCFQIQNINRWPCYTFSPLFMPSSVLQYICNCFQDSRQIQFTAEIQKNLKFWKFAVNRPFGYMPKTNHFAAKVYGKKFHTTMADLMIDKGIESSELFKIVFSENVATAPPWTTKSRASFNQYIQLIKIIIIVATFKNYQN